MTDLAGPAAGELLDLLPLAAVLIGSDRRVVGWNTAAEALYGYPSTDALGADVVDLLFDPDDRTAAAGLLGRAEGGLPWAGDFRVRRSDGALLVSSFRAAALADGQATTWIATDGLDQGMAEHERSELLQAERAARATAEDALGLVEAIITSAPVGIAVFDLDLRYVRVNDAYAALSGVPAADHVGGRFGDVVPPQANIAADLRRVVTTGRTILGRNVDLAEGDDAGRSFTVSCFPVRSATGALAGAGLTVVEVTEARRAEAERAALLRRAEAAQQRLEILATASTVLTTTMELDELLARLTRVLTPAAGDWCIIELIGRTGDVDHVAVSHRDRQAATELATRLRNAPIDLAGRGPVADVVRSGQARLTRPSEVAAALADAAADRGAPELAAEYSVNSSVIVPIEARGNVLGVLILSTEGERVLHDDDLDLAVEIAHRAALAVENSRAFQQEHQIAVSLQRALLPASVPVVDGLDIAVRYVAATDGASVGGDWYDVLDFADGTTGFVVGDVIGHDIAASTSMGQLRSALRTCAFEEHSAPAEALARVDRLFDVLGLSHATCVFGVLDRSASTFTWSNAGHPPPLLLRDGTAAFLDEGDGVLLGVTAGADLGQATVELRPGDQLVLYTDGLVERRGESLAAGLSRLGAMAAGAERDSAETLCDALLRSLLPPTVARDDDVAIVVVRVRDASDTALVHRLEFDLRPEGAALARGFTAGVLRGAGREHQVDTAVLLVSELVSNAVRHARGPCAIVVDLSGDGVVISVEDGDDRRPTPREAEDTHEQGRGLLIVSALADDWGVRSLDAGKAIWFKLA